MRLVTLSRREKWIAAALLVLVTAVGLKHGWNVIMARIDCDTRETFWSSSLSLITAIADSQETLDHPAGRDDPRRQEPVSCAFHFERSLSGVFRYSHKTGNSPYCDDWALVLALKDMSRRFARQCAGEPGARILSYEQFRKRVSRHEERLDRHLPRPITYRSRIYVNDRPLFRSEGFGGVSWR